MVVYDRLLDVDLRFGKLSTVYVQGTACPNTTKRKRLMEKGKGESVVNLSFSFRTPSTS